MNKPDFYRYIALLDYEKDGVHVTFPDLPGCVTFGQDEEEAIKEAREVAEASSLGHGGRWRHPARRLQLSKTCPAVKS